MQEMELLQHAASAPQNEQRREPRPPPPDIMQQLIGAAHNMQQQRQRLQAQVFRPTVALPTVSVEQQVWAHHHLVCCWELVVHHQSLATGFFANRKLFMVCQS